MVGRAEAAGMDERRQKAGRDVSCEYFTPQEVAVRLKLSIDMVYDLLREGQIPAIRIGRGKRQLWRIPQEEFEEYLAMIRVGQPQERHVARGIAAPPVAEEEAVPSGLAEGYRPLVEELKHKVELYKRQHKLMVYSGSPGLEGEEAAADQAVEAPGDEFSAEE